MNDDDDDDDDDESKVWSAKILFSNRVVNVCMDSLPCHVVNADTVNCFKSRVD